uniref:C-type lectin domain-containing protein n=1 Tax=Panagrolaimus davidi TaxID=227884 RepID=A0A914PNQ7_9BILA
MMRLPIYEASVQFTESTVDSVWIGAISSFANQSAWKWTDNSTFDFADFKKGQPSSDERCSSISLRDGLWQSEDCFKRKPFICTVLKNPPVINYCELGWIYYQPTNSCFGITYTGQNHPIVTSWEEGKTRCQRLGGDLPSFHDILAFVITAMRQIWIGLQSTDNSNTWSWSDGSNTNYLPWYKTNGFPLTMDISCGMANLSFITNHDCNSKAWVICKRPSC